MMPSVTAPAVVALGSPEYAATFVLRAAVLLDPFGISHERARADDERAIHFGIFEERDDEFRAAACLLLVPRESGVVQMRQVAVARERLRRGLGTQIVRTAELWAKDAGYRFVFANARAAALPFYRTQGYAEVGEPFVEVGLPHRRIEKPLGVELD